MKKSCHVVKRMISHGLRDLDLGHAGLREYQGERSTRIRLTSSRTDLPRALRKRHSRVRRDTLPADTGMSGLGERLGKKYCCRSCDQGISSYPQ